MTKLTRPKKQLTCEEYWADFYAHLNAVKEQERLLLIWAKYLAETWTLTKDRIDSNQKQLEDLKALIVEEVQLCWGKEAFVEFLDTQVFASHSDGRRMKISEKFVPNPDWNPPL